MHTCKWIVWLLMAAVSLAANLTLVSAAPASAQPEQLHVNLTISGALPGPALAGGYETSPSIRGDAGDKMGTAHPIMNGLNGQVRALSHDGGSLYVGGTFTAADDTPVSNVARWDGSTWSPIGNGLDGPVYALLWDSQNNILYAGGAFSHVCSSAGCSSATFTVNHVAVWDGHAWSGLGGGVDGDIYALALDSNNDLYAGGNFTSICAAPDCSVSLPTNHVAQWNPDNRTWRQLIMDDASNGVNGAVHALTWEGAPRNLLYVGGDFTGAGNVTANRVAAWNPSARLWASLDFGLSRTVRALQWDGTRGYLYAGGDFEGACENKPCSSSSALNYIAEWDGSDWVGLGGGLNDAVYALTLDSSHALYVGGEFTNAGSVAAKHVAKWTWLVSFGNWSALGNGSDSKVTALDANQDRTVAAGSFPVGEGGTAVGIGIWTQSAGTGSWSALTPKLVSDPTGKPLWDPGILGVAIAVLSIAFVVAVVTFILRILVIPRLSAPSSFALTLLLGLGAIGIAIVAVPQLLARTMDIETGFIAQKPTATTRALQTIPSTFGNSLAAAPSPVDTATPRPTLTATATPRPTLTATATLRPTLTATATLRPTLTATRPESSPTPTTIPATSTPSPITSTPMATLTYAPTTTATAYPTQQPTLALLYPAVPLREPHDGQKVVGESATFEWQDIGLGQTDHYELWLRRSGAETWQKGFRVAGHKFVLFIRDGVDYGDYIWTVSILDSRQQVVSQPGEERMVMWFPKSAPEPSSPDLPPKPPSPPVFVK